MTVMVIHFNKALNHNSFRKTQQFLIPYEKALGDNGKEELLFNRKRGKRSERRTNLDRTGVRPILRPCFFPHIMFNTKHHCRAIWETESDSESSDRWTQNPA